jgi:DNA mismatch repair ATPase MutS
VVEEEPDYTEDVLATFARFREHEAKSYLFKIQDEGSMNHVEAAIAGYVARLFPDTFATLQHFYEGHARFLDPLVAGLHRDAQFYLGYLDLMSKVRPLGVEFSIPDLAADGTLTVTDGVDLALALSVLGKVVPLVPNDSTLDPDARLLVVTGPNQGGKTTYARMLGQIHHLASVGVPVPARQAVVPVADQIRTLFERGENLADLRGHLYDDLVRARAIVESVGPHSLVILNEVFSSTTLDDALTLGREVLLQLRASGARSVCVTFLDELTELTSDTVSAVAAVDPEDPTRRTFEVVRRAADGRAYASALAEKYRVDYQAIKNRLSR